MTTLGCATRSPNKVPEGSLVHQGERCLPNSQDGSRIDKQESGRRSSNQKQNKKSPDNLVKFIAVQVWLVQTSLIRDQKVQASCSVVSNTKGTIGKKEGGSCSPLLNKACKFPSNYPKITCPRLPYPRFWVCGAPCRGHGRAVGLLGTMMG